MSIAYEEKAAAALEQLGLSVALGQLDGACQQAAAANWSYSHFLGYLLEGELEERHRKTVAMNFQFAKFPYTKRLEEVDYSAQPTLARRVVYELYNGGFIVRGRDNGLFGPPAVCRILMSGALGGCT